LQKVNTEHTQKTPLNNTNTDTIRVSSALIEFAESMAYCPCCEGVKECLPECTYEADCREIGFGTWDNYERMVAARAALAQDELRGDLHGQVCTAEKPCALCREIMESMVNAEAYRNSIKAEVLRDMAKEKMDDLPVCPRCCKQLVRAHIEKDGEMLHFWTCSC
jgi:hypothetical protein